MLRKLSIIPAFLLGSTCMFACTGSEPMSGFDGGPADSGTVPDPCTEATACPLMSGARFTEYVFPVGDTDLYTFSVPGSGQVVNVVVENDADFSPIRLEVAIFDPSNMAVVNDRHVGNGKQRVESQFVAQAAGTFSIRVRDVGNDAGDRSNPYFITVTVLEEADPNEPNDTKDAPTSLTVGTAANGVIGTQGDEDWFAFDLPANQLVQIEMLAPGAPETDGVRFRWELWNPGGEMRLAESDEPATDIPWPVQNRGVGNAPGRYLIRVLDEPGDGMQADLTRVYTLTVRVIPEPDVQDQTNPNETPTRATALTAGAPVTGFIGSNSDFDYFSIVTTRPNQLVVVEAQMSGLSDVDLAFQLLDTDGMTAICQSRDGDLCEALRFVTDGQMVQANLRTAHVAETPGTYYVLVRDLQDNEFDTATPYTLTVSLPTEPDTNENYLLNGRDGAVPVVASSTVGTTIQFPQVTGYISHAGDQDWYRFDMPGPGAPGQNGDWLIQFEVQIPGPTPVEMEAFFFGPENSPRERYRGYGKRCREGSPQDLEPCQFPDAENGINENFGEATGECFVVFREVTSEGPHYFRITDLDRDDFDLSAQYSFRLTLTAGCPAASSCMGIFTDGNGADLCGRP